MMLYGAFRECGILRARIWDIRLEQQVCFSIIIDPSRKQVREFRRGRIFFAAPLESELSDGFRSNANPYSENQGFSEWVRGRAEHEKETDTPQGSVCTGISLREYLLALRLTSELADLRAANANPYSENQGFSEWVRGRAEHEKETDTPQGSVCLFLVTRTGIEPMFSA